MALQTPEDFIPQFWESIYYRADPFQLRGGGESHYFVDAKHFLRNGKTLNRMGRFALQAADRAGIDLKNNSRAALVAQGSGAIALQVGMVMAAEVDYEVDLHFIPYESIVNTNLPKLNLPTSRLDNDRVVLVDDMFSTGSTLIEMAGKIKEAGATIEGAVVLGDRSDGAYYQALHDAGIPKLVSIYQFYEGSPPVLTAT